MTIPASIISYFHLQDCKFVTKHTKPTTSAPSCILHMKISISSYILPLYTQPSQPPVNQSTPTQAYIYCVYLSIYEKSLSALALRTFALQPVDIHSNPHRPYIVRVQISIFSSFMRNPIPHTSSFPPAGCRAYLL